ncbi:MAG: hypothetical protein II369_02410, partial [Clostridia bacterium]|nr:hypothetical protein [Clostridia bacterium]
MKHGMPKPGFRSTNLIVYAMGVQCERYGTLSDEEITLSMIERGYIVAVVDYLDNPLAVVPRVDFSLQNATLLGAKTGYLEDANGVKNHCLAFFCRGKADGEIYVLILGGGEDYQHRTMKDVKDIIDAYLK